jgi:phage-related protein (TIGR01555 family)|nr:MAG TPA: portal [Caudoviricetes sp.]
MAKNKRKKPLIATNTADDDITQIIEQETRKLTAQNSLEAALRCGNGLDNWSQTLSPRNAYNNLSLVMISQWQILLSYLYKTYGVLAKMIDIPVDDAYKGGAFTLETDSVDEAELKELEKTIAKNQDIKQIKNARKWARLYGGAALIALSGDDLSKPLDYKSLYGKPLEFMAVDRWQLSYSEPNINIPGGQWEYINQYGRRNSKKSVIGSNALTRIHSSRISPITGKEAPFIIMQRVNGWGISVFEQVFSDMSQYFKAGNVLFELLDEAKVDVIKLATLQTALSSGNSDQVLQKMLDLIANNLNYKSKLLISKDDDYDQKQISFSGLAEMNKEIRIMMAGSANMPVNKLWGEGVTGFGSGEDSLENYNSQIENEIRSADDAVIDWVLMLRSYQQFGFELPDLTKTWKNLRVLSAIDEQNIHDHKVANILQIYDRQLMSPQEVMEYLKKQQIVIQDTKALRGELEDMPLWNQQNEFTEIKDVTKE